MLNFLALIDHLAPDPAAARAAADTLRRAHPAESPAELSQHAIHGAKIKAATAGAATGVVSNPLTMVPAALADMAAMLKIEATMVGTIAALVDPAAVDDPHALRADVISIIFPAAASQALRQVGIRATERLSQAAVRKYATEDLVRTLSKFAARYLGKQLTRETILMKTVPLVGIGIGAGWNWLEVKAIGQRAVKYYAHEAIGPAAPAARFPRIRKSLPKVVRFLPRPESD